MTLIKSISGIRGTIGSIPGENLTPLDVVKFVSAYATWIKKNKNNNGKIIVGRDARISGDFISRIVTGTLAGCGFNVIDAGMATTPTVEMAVIIEKASGGIIITASHNPMQWNALKLLNDKGEFISAKDGEELLMIVNEGNYKYSDIEKIGSISQNDYLDFHINEILKLELVNTDLIKNANFKIAVDAVNSVGGVVIPKLLKKLGVKEIFELNCEPSGKFKHNPEPLPEHLIEISEVVKKEQCDLGIVVDPDVDRLALVCENGLMFGEEYTLVAVADYVLSKTPGNTVSNLSSTQALKIVTDKYKMKYHSAAVGEVNVVEKMKEVNAIIGGEGNGGVIYPELHYGRDALVGIALFLTYLAEKNMKVSELRKTFPEFIIVKKKVNLDKEIDMNVLYGKIAEKFPGIEIITIDGIKLVFEDSWVHIRKSNTEPVLRIYAEAGKTEIATKHTSVVENIIRQISH